MNIQYVVYDWSYVDYHDIADQDRYEKGRFDTLKEALDYKHQLQQEFQEKGRAWYALHEIDLIVEEVS